MDSGWIFYEICTVLIVLPSLFTQCQDGLAVVRRLSQLLAAWKASWLMGWTSAQVPALILRYLIWAGLTCEMVLGVCCRFQVQLLCRSQCYWRRKYYWEIHIYGKLSVLGEDAINNDRKDISGCSSQHISSPNSCWMKRSLHFRLGFGT